MKGIKYDEDKLDWTLLPFEALESVVKVLEFGAKKYSRDNWKKVEPKERYEKAAYRHLISYSRGEHEDSDSNLPHLSHAVCCLLFLIYKEGEHFEKLFAEASTGGDTGDQLLLQFM